MKFILTFLVIIALLTGCATIDHPCLVSALTKAEQVQEKENLLFVEGTWHRQLWSKHVQLWLLQNGEYGILTGALINEQYFKPTGFYSYIGYITKVKKLRWLSP